MNRLFSAKSFLVAAVAIGAVGAASAAHARTDVSVNIDLGTPAYVEPAPVYVQPRPVYVQPRPVYVEPRPVYMEPRPVYVEPAYGYHGQRRYMRRTGAWGDWDRDGVPNIYDRAPGNPYRR